MRLWLSPRRLLPLLLTGCLLLPPAVHADTPAYRWTARLDSESGTATPVAMTTAADGTVYIAGQTDADGGAFGSARGQMDGFIACVSPRGMLQWVHRLGGSGEDTFTEIIALSGGGCVALGSTRSADGDARASRGGMDAWLVRLDADGTLVYSKCLGGSADDALTVLMENEDGTLFACGRTQSRNGDLGANYGGWDAWAVLLSAEDGKPLTTYRYGFTGDDAFTTALPADGGWLLLGDIAVELSLTPEEELTYLQRPIVQLLTADFTPTWETPKILGDSGDNQLLGAVAIDGGWLLAGETSSRSAMMPAPHGGMDLWVLQMRRNGSAAWQRSYGGTGEEHFRAMKAAPDGGYWLLAETDSTDDQVYGTHGGTDVWLLKISAGGVLAWQQPIGGSGVSRAVGLFTDGTGLLLAGHTTVQDGDFARRDVRQTGFLAYLAENGNLEQVRMLLDTDANVLVQVAEQDDRVLLLCSLRKLDGGPDRGFWLGCMQRETGAAGE